MRKPDDKSPEPPGGRAAERLREFRRQRVPEDHVATEDIPVDSKTDNTQRNAHRSESEEKSKKQE